MSSKKSKSKRNAAKADNFDNHAFAGLRGLKQKLTEEEQEEEASSSPQTSRPALQSKPPQNAQNQAAQKLEEIDNLGLSDDELFRMYLNDVLPLEETSQGKDADSATGWDDRELAESKWERMKAPGLEEEAQLFLQAMDELQPGDVPTKDAHSKERTEPKRSFFPELDLHGKTRVQALRLLDAYLQSAHHHQIDKVEVVVGRGLHSAEEPVLRRVVKRALAENRLRVVRKFYSGKPGVFVVELKQKKRH